MPDDEAREGIAKLLLQHLALRDVVSRLVALEAARSGDPERVLQRFVDGVDARIDTPREGRAFRLQHAEIIRIEIDQIISDARKMLRT
jgi:hypothetical protein